MEYLHPWESGLPSNVTSANQTTTSYFEIFAQPVSEELYMTLTISAAIVALVAFILLLHLSMFHIYINCVGITTYEYVRAVRISMENQLVNQPEEPQHQSNQIMENRCCQLLPNNAKVGPMTTATAGLKIITGAAEPGVLGVLQHPQYLSPM